MLYLDTLTNAELLRLYDRIMRRCYRDCAGGLRYGMDWPTLRTVFPHRYAVLREIIARGKPVLTQSDIDKGVTTCN